MQETQDVGVSWAVSIVQETQDVGVSWAVSIVQETQDVGVSWAVSIVQETQDVGVSWAVSIVQETQDVGVSWAVSIVQQTQELKLLTTICWNSCFCVSYFHVCSESACLHTPQDPYTDHSAILPYMYIVLENWLDGAELNLDITYRPGRRNANIYNTNVLSRVPAMVETNR